MRQEREDGAELMNEEFEEELTQFSLSVLEKVHRRRKKRWVEVGALTVRKEKERISRQE